MSPEIAIGIVVFLGFLFSIVVHECAHGIMAYWRGDDTAYRLGRITLDPIPHIDPFMSILLPGVLLLSGLPAFGGARPVPVIPQNLYHPKRDMMWVAWAGPMSNIILGVIFALLGNLAPLAAIWNPQVAGLLFEVTTWLVFVNFILAGFNLIPVPPLDGSRILAGLLPGRQAEFLYRLEPYGLLLVGVLIFSGVVRVILVPILGIANWLVQNLTFFA